MEWILSYIQRVLNDSGFYVVIGFLPRHPVSFCKSDIQYAYVEVGVSADDVMV
jgi:hypothetical protein